MNEDLIKLIRNYYDTNEFIPLHAPIFYGNESKYVEDTIKSTYVSSVGKYVDSFENSICEYTGSPKAVAIMNGTAALHIALKSLGVSNNDLVITQSLTFIATCNAISYCGADPVFIDVDKKTLGLSPEALEKWLHKNTKIDKEGICRYKKDKRKISVCVPMHTFGHPVRMDELLDVCTNWNLNIIEDAAESLGSFYKSKHTGTIGNLGTLSFNGNKTITTGGGGMVLADQKLGNKIKHLSTTAKIPHKYEFFHDEVGYNYRLPNINAALGCAQLENLTEFLAKKRELAQIYKDFFKNKNYKFFEEPEDCISNYWLNTIICESKAARENLLQTTNDNQIMTRPIWKLMNSLPMYRKCIADELENSKWLEERIVNLPSSVKI